MVTRQKTDDGLPQIGFGDSDARVIPLEMEETEDMALSNLLATLGGDVESSVYIYREGPGGHRDVTYLTECPPDEFSMARLQDEFNGGNFRIHVRSEGRIMANKPIRVAPRPTAQNNQSLLAPVQSQINDLAGIVKQLAVLVADSRQPQAIQQPQAQSRKEMLEEFLMMKDLMGGGPPPRQVDPFDQMTKVLELSKTVSSMSGGGGGDAPDALSVIMKGMEVFGKPLAEAAAAQRLAMAGAMQNPIDPRQISLPLDQQPIPAQPAQTEATTESNDMMQLQFYLSYLVGKAKGNSDPVIYAGLMVDNMTDEQINALLLPADWFEKLCGINKEASAFREWFSEMRQVALEMLTDDEAADTTEEITPPTSSAIGKSNAPKGTAKAGTKGNT